MEQCRVAVLLGFDLCQPTGSGSVGYGAFLHTRHRSYMFQGMDHGPNCLVYCLFEKRRAREEGARRRCPLKWFLVGGSTEVRSSRAIIG